MRLYFWQTPPSLMTTCIIANEAKQPSVPKPAAAEMKSMQAVPLWSVQPWVFTALYKKRVSKWVNCTGHTFKSFRVFHFVCKDVWSWIRIWSHQDNSGCFESSPVEIWISVRAKCQLLSRFALLPSKTSDLPGASDDIFAHCRKRFESETVPNTLQGPVSLSLKFLLFQGLAGGRVVWCKQHMVKMPLIFDTASAARAVTQSQFRTDSGS